MDKFRDQELLLYELQKFMNSEDMYFLVQGSAGTGKTYTVGTFLKMYDDDECIVTGPTHKSVTVLRDTLKTRGVITESFTLHRLLHYEHRYDKEGNDIFEPNKASWNTYLSKYDDIILVLDEASMIDDTLKNNIYDFVHYLNKGDFIYSKHGDRESKEYKSINIKVIVMGDMYQLPPVKYNKISKLFNIDKSAYLHTVIRADNDHILNCYKIFRDNVLYGNSEKFRNEFLDLLKHAPNNVIRICDKYDYERYLKYLFVKKKNEKNIILSACNKPVQQYNKQIIDLLYPESKTKYNAGQQLYYKKYCSYPTKSNTCDVIIINNMEIKTIDFDDDNYFKLPSIKIYVMEVYKLDYDETYKIKCIHEDYEKIFNKSTSDKRLWIKNEIKNGAEAQALWSSYYRNYYELNQPVDYYYALTVYKSQGSTFDNVFVDMTEILNRYKTTHFLQSRELYTAISRAKKTLIIKYDDFIDNGKILNMCSRCHMKNAVGVNTLNSNGKPFKTCQRCRKI